LISELCVARESEGGSVIVILAEKEKEEMEYAAPPAHQSTSRVPVGVPLEYLSYP
jgi:hypothetical protein